MAEAVMQIRKNVNAFVVGARALLAARPSPIRVVSNRVRTVTTTDLIVPHAMATVALLTAHRVTGRKVIGTRREVSVMAPHVTVTVPRDRVTEAQRQPTARVLPAALARIRPETMLLPIGAVRRVLVLTLTGAVETVREVVALQVEIMPTGAVAAVGKPLRRPMFGRLFSKPTPGCKAILPTGVPTAGGIAEVSARKTVA
ncbi:hypothetical protein GCM10027190_48920 [Spirosoma areae]